MPLINGGIMNKLKYFAKNLWKDESGQGTAEYVLLIAIVVGIIVAFGPKIKGLIEEKVGQISTGFGEVQ